MGHYQVNVNGIMIDEEIAPLVRKLWARDMRTDSSCRGNYHRSPAYLMFDLLEDAIDFMTSSIEATGCFDFDLSPFSGETGPRGRVCFPTGLIEKLEAVW